MQNCPLCGRTAAEQKHWVRCPREGAAICMNHCFPGCEHLARNHCTFIKRAAGAKEKPLQEVLQQHPKGEFPKPLKNDKPYLLF